MQQNMLPHLQPPTPAPVIDLPVNKKSTSDYKLSPDISPPPTSKCIEMNSIYTTFCCLVPRPHYCARPMRFGS